jgi:glyoxylase-like metal-dependent hydrolase (beta-lactamase superfamily II)
VTSPWICRTCGAHYAPAPAPPPGCFICEDERQWVPPSGPQWTRLDELAARGYHSDIRELEPGLLGIGVAGKLGVGQRALLVQTDAGNILWDPPAFVDDAAIAAVRARGELRAVSASHPHMYGSIVEWGRIFAAEILLPLDDTGWLARPEAGVRRYSGSAEPLAGVTLIQCGGHFPGSAALHWAAGADGAGALLTGDTLFVTPGEDRVTFAWSAPNRLPLPEREVRGIVAALSRYRFERIYDGWWEAVVRRDAAAIVKRSAQRYIEFLRGDAVGSSRAAGPA